MNSDNSVPCNIENGSVFLRLLLSSFFLISGGLAGILVFYRPTTLLNNTIQTAYAASSFVSSLASYTGIIRQMGFESASKSAIQLAIQTQEKSK